MTTVSVVIPAYNSAAFIEKTLESVFRQTVRPIEIIVVDDASTDGTPELVSCIAISAPCKVRILRCAKNHGGPPGPLNIAITQADGDLIATLDHDDLMLPSKLELQLQLYERCPELGLIISQVDYDRTPCPGEDVVARSHTVFENLPRRALGDGFFRVAARDAYNAATRGCYALTCSSFLFPKAVWHDCGGFNEHFPSMPDWGFLQAVTRRYDLGIVAADLVRWTRLPGCLSRRSNGKYSVSQFLRFHTNFDHRLLTVESQAFVRATVREHYLWEAFLARLEPNCGRALAGYIASIYHAGYCRQALVGIATLFPELVFRATRRATRTLCGAMKRVGNRTNTVMPGSAEPVWSHNSSANCDRPDGERG